MITFPYGISDFNHIRCKGMLYVDRTTCIPALEAAGQQLLFLRPRRFGKSLLLSMLANYYDINKADEFAWLFADLAVGTDPTPEHNQYLILQWDFSKVSPMGDVGTITSNLFDHLNNAVTDCVQQNQQRLAFPVTINAGNGIASFESLANVVRNSGYQLYLLIDEYDNFANEVLMQARTDEARYKALLHGEGILKTLFKTIKGCVSEGKIGRVFITGVSPVVMSDMTSGYNVATSIYLDNEFNSLCGLTSNELQGLVEMVTVQCQQPAETAAITLETMRVFYNGYRFCYDTTQERVYNPTLCFYFLRHFQRNCQPPEKILDGNLAMDAGKIAYIASQPGGNAVIHKVLDEQNTLLIESLAEKFGVEALQSTVQGEWFMVSLMYFFGVLTITGRGTIGELAFGVPNLVIRRLYLDELRDRTLPAPQDTDMVRHLASQFYRTADLQPLVDFMESKYFAVFNNRDYRWSNELTIKTAFLTLLFNDTYYIMDSETALQRRYSDLTLIVRPNMRQYPALLDMVLEFKYLGLKELGLSTEQVRGMSRAELQQLPLVVTALQDATQQLQQYRAVLVEKYSEPQRLRCLVVVALGFERLVWEVVLHPCFAQSIQHQ
ncbi:AAA family ATPase [uncultured Thiothrix sp.]|mgnify:CR=1 FL=1|uniref:AAA family ATPase n=1 Tax=uncultured Thiothrix sp. TaxID=223185 RepID=UPI00261CBA01|nr:AAA family ATPase [uncultured Thiothrix sp.]HMT94594.1 AAA family ATPase [Thiolinea sp.]